MLETNESLIPKSDSANKVVTIGFDEDSMEELHRLLKTLELDLVGHNRVVLKKINPATYIGKGKVEEIKKSLEENGAGAVIVDVELSPNQLRNLEKAFGKAVLDRPGV